MDAKERRVSAKKVLIFLSYRQETNIPPCGVSEMHDYMDVGGRVTQEAKTEELFPTLSSCLGIPFQSERRSGVFKQGRSIFFNKAGYLRSIYK